MKKNKAKPKVMNSIIEILQDRKQNPDKIKSTVFAWHKNKKFKIKLKE